MKASKEWAKKANILKEWFQSAILTAHRELELNTETVNNAK